MPFSMTVFLIYDSSGIFRHQSIGRLLRHGAFCPFALGPTCAALSLILNQFLELRACQPVFPRVAVITCGHICVLLPVLLTSEYIDALIRLCTQLMHCIRRYSSRPASMERACTDIISQCVELLGPSLCKYRAWSIPTSRSKPLPDFTLTHSQTGYESSLSMTSYGSG